MMPCGYAAMQGLHSFTTSSGLPPVWYVGLINSMEEGVCGEEGTINENALFLENERTMNMTNMEVHVEALRDTPKIHWINTFLGAIWLVVAFTTGFFVASLFVGTTNSSIPEYIGCSQNDVMNPLSGSNTSQVSLGNNSQIPLVHSSSSPTQSTVFFDNRIIKRTTSPIVRFLFIAGIEGSGHHIMSDIYSKCKQLKGPCEVNDDISSQMYTKGGNPVGLFVLGSKAQSSKSISEKRQKFVATLKQEVAKCKVPKIIFLNTAGPGVAKNAEGMMSYPNFGGNDKSVHHPDVRILAQLFEEAGADLQVLVLQVFR